MTSTARTKKVTSAKIPPVALHQRSGSGVSKYGKLTPVQLHQQTMNAREAFSKMCVGTETYAVDVLLPYCEEIIARYRMPGVGTKDRPNGKPTVEAYFRSIKLNYNTVRSWIHRRRLSTEMFDPQKATSHNKDGDVPHLTLLEAKLLGTASAGHDLVKAIRQDGNLDEAIREFEDHAPAPERIEEYIERRVQVVVTELENMAVRLCKLIGRNDDKNAQKILVLARELLAKAEPATVEEVVADEKQRQQREAKKKMPPHSEKTVVPSGQPTNDFERKAQ
jgi:hypothetical protein